jgi:hypothetical protein
MRAWFRLFTVCLLLSSLAGAARSAVLFSGLDCTQVGQAAVSTSPDGKHIFVSNFSVSGLDGMDITVSGMDGHEIQARSGWSAVDAGAECRYSWGTTNPSSVGGGGLAHGRTGLKRTTEGVEWLCDLSELSHSPSMTCLLYLHDALITSVSVPSSCTFTLQSPPAVTTVIPTGDFELDRASHRCLASVAMESPALFVFGGLSLQVDRVVCVSDLDGDGRLDVCAMRCSSSSNPASSFSSLDCSSMSCVRFGHAMTALDVQLDGLPDDVLQVSSLGKTPLERLDIQSSLFTRVYGHGGGGGGGALSTLDSSSPAAALKWSRTNGVSFSPSDDGASFACTVVGSSNNDPPGVVASIETREILKSFFVTGEVPTQDAVSESVFVSHHGVVVARAAVPLGSSVEVQAPPGGPPEMTMTQCGSAKGAGYDVVANKKVMTADAGAPAGPRSSTVLSSDGVAMSVSFLNQRVFLFGGQSASGDQLTFAGASTSPLASVPITITGTNFSLQRSLAGTDDGAMDVVGVSDAGLDQVYADVPSSVAISSATPVVDVAVKLERITVLPSRGVSVTLHLSSNLAVAGPVQEYDYFSRFGTSQMFTVPNPDGSLTVDLALLGPGCGPSSSGQLFTIPVMRAPGAPDGVGTVSVDAVELADCVGAPIPVSSGDPAQVVLDSSAPAPVTLTATPVLTGNDADGTIRIALSWTATEPGASVQLYRASFGNYPDYDDGPGAGSAAPPFTLPPSSRWSPVSLSCGPDAVGTTVCTDESSSRDTYQFAIVVRDAYGNLSAPSNTTPGLPNYHLGDVAGGGVPCGGDNQVTTADISALGAHYGLTLPVGSPFECLDVGPTVDGAVTSRPVTDHRLSFADLIVYAINYSLVSMPASAPRALATASDALRLQVPPLPGVGQTFDVGLEMSGAGDVQGLSAQLAYDPAVVEPVAATQGELLAHQGREGVLLSSQPGDVDAALLGVGAGIAGEGELARVTFRVKREGDPGLGIGSVDARDAQNRPLAMGGVGVPGAKPGHTALRMAFPNPFDRSTTVLLSLSQTGPASVRVFDVAGRTVRTLLRGVQPAGERVLAWDGRDDAGSPLSAGVYLLRLDAGGHSETRSVRLVK